MHTLNAYRFTQFDSFLDDTARIAALDYVPTDRAPPRRSRFLMPWLIIIIIEGDIMRARIRTLGVEEHRFVTESGTRLVRLRGPRF